MLLYSSLLLLIFNRCLELMVLLAGGDRTTYYNGRSHIYSRRQKVKGRYTEKFNYLEG
ncbi:hypothetical protein [Phormidium nigroviride]